MLEVVPLRLVSVAVFSGSFALVFYLQKKYSSDLPTYVLSASNDREGIGADRIRNLFPETKELIDANNRQGEFWRSGHSRNASTLYPTR